jgi:hypothetical protein
VHSWFELAPREFENLLRGMLTAEYDHNDPLESLGRVEAFAGRMLKLLQKVADLHPSTVVPKPKIAGWLVVNSANRSRQAFPISTEHVVVGREEGDQQHCDIVIPGDPGISRRHVRINVGESNGPAQFSITDLNSANGAFVHDTGTRLKPGEPFTLVDGDTFQIGKTNLVIRTGTVGSSEQEAIKSVLSLKVFPPAELVPQYS